MVVLYTVIPSLSNALCIYLPTAKKKDNAETCTGLSRAFHPTLWPININYQNVTFNSPIPRHDDFFRRFL
jgi:hypothetical protein